MQGLSAVVGVLLGNADVQKFIGKAIEELFGGPSREYLDNDANWPTRAEVNQELGARRSGRACKCSAVKRPAKARTSSKRK